MCKFGKTWGLLQLLVCLVLVALAPPAQANIVPVGTSSVAPDVFAPITGTTLATRSGTMMSIFGDIDVSFTTSVISDPGNPFCANCLDFVYDITNKPTGDDNGRYTMNNFGGWMVDGGYVPTATGRIPNFLDRSGGTGPTIGFDYPGGDSVLPGQSTVTLVLKTNAPGFINGRVTAQDGDIGGAIAFQPAIPEPSSLAMLGGGLLVVGGFARRFVRV